MTWTSWSAPGTPATAPATDSTAPGGCSFLVRHPARQGAVPAPAGDRHRPDEWPVRVPPRRVDLDRLNPVGFKVLLEILVRHPAARVAEVAYELAPRTAGDSKASLRAGRDLPAARRPAARGAAGRAAARAAGHQGRADPPAGRFFAFGLVGPSGVVVNTAALWLLFHSLACNHLLAATLATQVSTTWNFVLIDTLVYRERGNGTRTGRAVRFFLMNNLLLLARLPGLAVA